MITFTDMLLAIPFSLGILLGLLSLIYINRIILHLRGKRIIRLNRPMPLKIIVAMYHTNSFHGGFQNKIKYTMIYTILSILLIGSPL